MTNYLNNKGQSINLEQLWRGIEEHCQSLEGAGLVLEKQVPNPDLQHIQTTLCFVLDGLAQARTVLRDNFQPKGFKPVWNGEKVVTVPVEEEV